MNLNNLAVTLLSKYSPEQVICSIKKIISDRHNLEYGKYLVVSNNTTDIEELTKIGDYVLIKLLEKIFYLAELSPEERKNTGVVYTPDYIVDYIIKGLPISLDKKYIDPSCGCGSFLLRLIIEAINQKINPIDFINNCVYGIDISNGAVEITKTSIQLLLISQGFKLDSLQLNIKSCDSLKADWKSSFALKSNFDYIIGNPPYVKVQNLTKEYYDYLKNTFSTTQFGGFNLFYAFIEKSIKEIHLSNGEMRYIVPNNFLKIKSGKDLRDYIKCNNVLNRIVDFDCNIIFDDILTYNCILWLKNSSEKEFEYQTIYKTNNLEEEIKKITYSKMNIDELDNDAWILNSPQMKEKIKLIERFPNKLGPMIKTGIATLKDKAYLIDRFDNKDYFKIVDGKEYKIESSIVRKIYRPSDIENHNDISKNVGYIIFPYKEVNGKNVPLEEEELKENYPNAYSYFLSVKDLLATRNGKKGEIKPWFAYGRSQGINNIGPKFIFSPFLDRPKFIYCQEPDALLYGFAVYVANDEEAELIKDFINSNVLKFYIDNTSYSIDGGFKCYQKKYLQNFSFPSNNEIKALKLNALSKKEKDRVIEKLYFDC